MRAISLVNKIEFEFKGNVVRSALTLGDVDNDGCNELVIGNDQGEVAIFKGSRRLQTIPDLGFVACVAVGDIRNVGKNSLVIIASNGWCYIYEIPPESPDSPDISSVEEVTVNEIDLRVEADETDGQGQSSSNAATSTNTETHSSEESTTVTERRSSQSPLICVHKQRIPANVKTLILGDIDGDGLLEIVVGLTDRVVRSYRFIAKAPDAPVCEKKLLGKLVALTKWECANQIGSISMHHSSDGSPSILVAQPGGTFMRIKCQIGDTTGPEVLSKSSSSTDEPFPGSVDYQSLGISRMRNQNISTEIVGDLKQPKKSGKAEAGSSKSVQKSRPYAVATLDGTIMLVQDEVILWAIAVDHQIFALTKLDVTGDGSDDIVVCTWDGLTYILDQQKNSVRFHLEEPVKAFESGWYSLDDNPTPVTALVYVTFKNTIVLYYDISIKDLLCKRFEPDLDKLSELFINKDTTRERALEYVKSMDKKTRKDLIEYLLYDATS